MCLKHLGFELDVEGVKFIDCDQALMQNYTEHTYAPQDRHNGMVLLMTIIWEDRKFPQELLEGLFYLFILYLKDASRTIIATIIYRRVQHIFFVNCNVEYCNAPIQSR